MINSKIGLDDIDMKIVQIIQKDPTITHTMIAKRVNRSQPTVGLRVKKLEKSGILHYQAGFNLNQVNLVYAKVDIETKYPEKIIKIIKKCPYMIHAYRVSGLNNLVVVIAASSTKNVEKIVNFHFRNNPKIQNVTLEFITGIINEFILPLGLNFKQCECSKVIDNEQEQLWEVGH
ncbi:MAG: winged helix-turn-helix transcriptional regulator [Candidatus Lokiarchaeota archaeon]|nr:winged helix-turn-helix transcriptional regulator [Candidatus Lokiarchaeota archaeon]MBD3343298.1 winged helix-turn-helix transcriptional regulator [Candidatus Lokiarchaeota archaeon]